MTAESTETVTDEELLSMDEAIEKLRTSRPTFYRWLRSGRIKGLKVGRQWRFYASDLERFLQGEGPLVDLPVGIGPLLADLELQLQEAETEALPVDETAGGAFERMLQLAVALRAESLHLEAVLRAPGEQMAVLRCRIDGVLRTLAEFDRRLLAPLLAAARQSGQCDSGNGEPQEGQLYYDCAAPRQSIELRLLFLPTALGESLSALILNRSLAEQISLSRIGLPEPVEAQLRSALSRGWGLIVAAGPTGSGKTTTLYAALNEVAGPELKSFALEDPVEMYFPWVSSLGVRQGQSFAEMMRTVMMADPDVLMISELRDAASLQQALRIAITGHLVLTCLHAPDAVRSLLRMVEAGGNAYSVSEAVSLILNQRLVRRLCPHCRRQGEPAAELLPRLQALLLQQGLELPATCWHAVGCGQCHAGYRGQLQLTEALSLSPALNRALLADADEAELRRIWFAEGGRSWVADGLARAAAGETSLEEIVRVAGLPS